MDVELGSENVVTVEQREDSKPSDTHEDTETGDASWYDAAFQFYTTGNGFKAAKHHTVIYELYNEQNERALFTPGLSGSIQLLVSQCLKLGSKSLDGSLENIQSCMERLDRLPREAFDDLSRRVAGVLTTEPGDIDLWKKKLDELLGDTFFCARPKTGALPIEPLDSPAKERQEKATLAAWETPFTGQMHDELWNYIAAMTNQNSGKDIRYANLCAIIQSSGTGKSRTVDQLGTEHFVISMCLRKPGTDGFPPPDAGVWEYFMDSIKFIEEEDSTGFSRLSDKPDKEHANKRINAFLQALFLVTREKVMVLSQELFSNAPDDESDRYLVLARRFRDLMTKGQSFSNTNAYRKSFYDLVRTRAADNFSEASANKTRKACNLLTGYLRNLCPEEYKSKRDPLVVIAFDESATLTESPDPDTRKKPSPLSRLLNRLSQLNECSLFSLFLSTTGHIATFLSKYGLPDLSTRIVYGDMRLNPAFTGCIFDSFACEAKEGALTIQEAASEWYMMHLGRPLWATRLRNENAAMRQNAMQFAVGKLLNWRHIPRFKYWKLELMDSIACLAVRLPLEFFLTSYIFQKSLVENHMRICLRLDPQHESMLTMSVSEPVLAEAAFVVMRNDNCKVLDALSHVISGFFVHRGDRGELIGLLLLLLARDKVIAQKNDSEMWKTCRLRGNRTRVSVQGKNGLEDQDTEELLEWDRVFRVPEFIRELFMGLDEEILKGIEEDFANCNMHFNHFIKPYHQASLEPRFLMGMLARGAGVLCANNQEALDTAIPYVRGSVLERSSIGQLLFQIQNHGKYGDEPQYDIHDNMEPVQLGIVDADDTSPTIRIVFALASRKSAIHARKTIVNPVLKNRKTGEVKHGKPYVAYDIWCAGHSSQYLNPIENTQQETTWQDVLAATQPWKSNYTPPGENGPEEYLQAMTPGMGLTSPFWQFFPDVLRSVAQAEAGQDA